MLIESTTVLTERLKGCREFAGRDLSSRQEGSIDTPWQGDGRVEEVLHVM